MSHKLAPDIVLYMPPEVLNPIGEHEGAACGVCMMFMPDLGACTIVHKDDDPEDSTVSGKHGVCGLYVGGKPMPSTDYKHKPMPIVPRSVASYYEGKGVPTHCGNCSKYIPFRQDDKGACRVIEGTVEEYGCCNAWTQEPNAPSPRRLSALGRGRRT